MALRDDITTVGTEFVPVVIGDVICITIFGALLGRMLWPPSRFEGGDWAIHAAGLVITLVVWCGCRLLAVHRLAVLKRDSNAYRRQKGRVEYNLEDSFDGTFSRVLGKLHGDGDYQVRLLNYTSTGFPPRFCENAALLLSEAVNRAIPSQGGVTPEAITVRVKTVHDPHRSEPRLINLPKLIEHARENSVSSFAELLLKIGASRHDLATLVPELAGRMRGHSSQAAYLLRESFWLWDPESKFSLQRMYYLAPDADLAALEHTSERFVFACSSIANALFSPRYSLGILPGRLAYAHSDQFSYYIINALTGDKTSAWVLSGLGPQRHGADEEELPHSMLLQAGQNNEEWIVGCKCHHIGDYSDTVWRELTKSQLVLFDASTAPPTLFLNRCREFYSAIQTNLGQGAPQRAAALEAFYNAFERIMQCAERVGLCGVPAAGESGVPGRVDALLERGTFCDEKGKRLLAGEVTWRDDDLRAFESFFLS